MIRLVVLAGLLVLSACHRQSFDERYSKAERDLDSKAKRIDNDLAASASDAAAAGILPSDEATDAVGAATGAH